MPNPAIFERVTVLKQGADLNKCGSVTSVTATGVNVVLEDGNDRQSGGELPPAAPKFFLFSEVGQP